MYDKIEWAAVDDLNCMRISGSLKKSTETGQAKAY